MFKPHYSLILCFLPAVLMAGNLPVKEALSPTTLVGVELQNNRRVADLSIVDLRYGHMLQGDPSVVAMLAKLGIDSKNLCGLASTVNVARKFRAVLSIDNSLSPLDEFLYLTTKIVPKLGLDVEIGLSIFDLAQVLEYYLRDQHIDALVTIYGVYEKLDGKGTPTRRLNLHLHDLLATVVSDTAVIVDIGGWRQSDLNTIRPPHNREYGHFVVVGGYGQMNPYNLILVQSDNGGPREWVTLKPISLLSYNVNTFEVRFKGVNTQNWHYLIDGMIQVKLKNSLPD